MEVVLFVVLIFLFIISNFLRQIKNEIIGLKKSIFFENGVPVRVKEIISDKDSPLYVKDINPRHFPDVQNVHVANMPDYRNPMECKINAYPAVDVNVIGGSIDVGSVHGVVTTERYVKEYSEHDL